MGRLAFLDIAYGHCRGGVVTLSRPPRTGRLGQSAFQTLCHNAGLTVNAADDDQNGWDFLVEFPPAPSKLPADRRPAPLKAFVQIKSTFDRRRLQWPLKLSNALQFTDSELPCFTVLLLFETNATLPIGAYVKHFWDKDIEIALAEARRASAVQQPLHQKSLAVKFCQADLVRPDDLLERIESIVLGCGSEYSKQKRELKRTAGAGDQRFRVTTKFRAGVTPERLLQAMVGEGGSLDVDEFRVVDNRFGVAVSRDDLTGPGRLKIEPKGKTAGLTFTRSGRSDEIRLQADTYFASLPGLESNLYKVRVKASFIELVTNELSSGEFTVHIDTNTPQSILETRALVAILAWLSEGEVEFSLDCPLGNLWFGKCSVAAIENAPFWRATNEILQDLFKVFPLERWPIEPKFEIAELNQNLEVIFQFLTALTRGDTQWTLDSAAFTHQLDVLASPPTLFSVVYLDLGNVTLFALYSANVIAATTHDGITELTLSLPEVLRSRVLRGRAQNNWAFMRAQTAAEWEKHPNRRLYTELAEQPPDEDEGHLPEK